MSCLYYHLFALLLLADDYIYSSSAIQQSELISAKIQSYGYDFTTSKPQIKPKYVDYAYSFTTFKPKDHAFHAVPSLSSTELTEANSNNVKTSFGSNEDLSTEESDEDPPGPPDHVIPYSEHENPREPSTRPNYTAPGEWAKPPKDKNIPLDFVPTKLYAQVRGTHTVKHLPKEASADSVSVESDEEKENAARLKEVVKVSKANTIYTEEGYEDAAYDHAGQIRDADFQEGFAKKLDNEKGEKRSYAGKHRRRKRFKKPKRRKNKTKRPRYLDDDYRDHEEGESISHEARIAKEPINPESLKYLKVTLNQPSVNPKSVVEDGLYQLEKDLRKESYEIERTSTEPYTPTTTTYTPPVVEPMTESNVHYETTVTGHSIYTIRPKKSPSAVRISNSTRIKRPARYYTTSKNNGNYNYYKTNSNVGEATTVEYDHDSLQFYANRQNQTSTTPYQNVLPETENANNTFTSNSLAITDFNGHGPYLLLVTSTPRTGASNSLEYQNIIRKNNYVANPVKHVTSPVSENMYLEPNPFYTPQFQNINNIKNHESIFPKVLQDTRDNILLHRLDQRLNGQDYESKNLEESDDDTVEKHLDSEESYLTLIQPPRDTEDLDTYLTHLRSPYGNMFKQWSVAHESEKPVESVYDIMTEAERPSTEPMEQKNTLPVTRLLPPAPLSGSEYSSFYIKRKRSDPVARSVISIVPIIEAINKNEKKKNSFPFLFRKKRSTVGVTREWEILKRDKKLRDAEIRKIAKASLKQENKKHCHDSKQPPNFEQLLNESPVIATDVVNREIQERFKNKSRESSNKSSSAIRYETSQDISHENYNEKKEAHNDDPNKSVEVEVPELDFSNVFQEDEIEVTTEKLEFDAHKYPFYSSSKVERNNVLKYIVNPLEVPRKTLGGMEFYDSRILDCEEIDPSLDELVPEEEDLENKHGPRKGKPRLYGLGDKVDCHKAKYFDENPLDNPLFFEKEIEVPSPPSELNPKIFASRILEIPENHDAYVILRGPKMPEEYASRKSQTKYNNLPKKKYSESEQNYKYFIRPRKPSSIQYQSNPGSLGLALIDETNTKSDKTRSKQSIKKTKLKITPSYQRHVYEDVMGTIKNIENTYNVPRSKKEWKSMNSKHRWREYNREPAYDGTYLLKNRRPANIDGLIPPPLHVLSFLPYKNRKQIHYNQKYHRHRSSGSIAPSRRIYKRSINVTNNNTRKEDIISNKYNNNNNNNNTNTKRNIFRIILTTPVPEKPKRKRKNFTIVSTEPIIQKTNSTSTDQTKHLRRSEADVGKYDKFVNKKNISVSVDLRRNEPRYNISNRRFLLNTINNISNGTEFKAPTINSKPSFSDSTLIPVIVKPDESFIRRVPQESKATYTKRKIDKTENSMLHDNTNKHNDEIDETKEIDSNNIKNQYSVHENIQEEHNLAKDDDSVTNFTPILSTEKEKDLLDFLKGDPPGYKKTFYNEKHPDSNENRSIESLRNEETQENVTTEDVYPGYEEKNTKKPYIDSSDDVEEQPLQDDQSSSSEEETITTTSSHSDKEPFTRFSDRPYSPPENYEDDLYSDIGPRVNKPYFYHPPFEVPEYEKSTFGTPINLSNDDNWSENQEVGRYIFPWEKDEEEDEEEGEKGDESKHYSSIDRYEFPWEKRERKEKERKRREKLERKYGKSYFDNIQSDEEDENSQEASNTNLRYLPLKKIHSRGKKDVSSVSVNMENHPSSKFSSKYKSEIIKPPLETDKMLHANNDTNGIKESIINSLGNSKITTPRILEIIHKSDVNTSKSSDIISHLSNKLNHRKDHDIKSEYTTAQPPNDTSTLNSSELNRTIITLDLLNSTPKNHRIRSRKNQLKNNSSQPSDLKESFNQVKENPTSSISISPSIRTIRRQNRIRNSTTDHPLSPAIVSTTSSTSTSSTSFNSRRRNRLRATTETSSVISTTSKSINPRRRRPFHIKPKNENVVNSPITDEDRITISSSSSPSTGKTIEHHSRVSKEEIITKTFYPDEGEDDDKEDDIHRKSSKIDSIKISSQDKPITLNLRDGTVPKNVSQEDHSRKKEKVERVTITMEETPDHVYRTKEIDKDGVKGKFVSITANNNTTRRKENDSLETKDPELEEIKRRMDAFNSFDSVVRDSDSLSDEAAGDQEIENYLLGNLLQKLPVPATRRLKLNKNEGDDLSHRRVKEDADDEDDNEEEEAEEEDGDDDDDDDEDEIDSDNDNENNNDEDSDEGDGDDDNDEDNEKIIKENKMTAKSNTTEKPSVGFIKDPNNRKYFYVDNR